MLLTTLFFSSLLSLPHGIEDIEMSKPGGSESDYPIKAPPAISKFPSALGQQSLVKSLISKIDESQVRAHLVRLTQFPERYYKSDNGVAAAQWLYTQVVALNASASPDVLLTVRYFNHPQWKQPSVVARLEARNNQGPGDIIITGTHFDTVGKGSGKPEPNLNPAADDCASGSSVIAETLRILVSEKVIPKRPIEFHWYAAEEVGLFGSKEVAKDYSSRQVKVFSYLNLDQAGYVKEGTKPTIGIFTDYTTAAATNFMRLTIAAYTTITNVVDSRCGYRCTDNASWFDAGYNAALAFESDMQNATPYNDRVKSNGGALDTLETINFPHVLEFVRNTIGFVVELSMA